MGDDEGDWLVELLTYKCPLSGQTRCAVDASLASHRPSTDESLSNINKLYVVCDIHICYCCCSSFLSTLLVSTFSPTQTENRESLGYAILPKGKPFVTPSIQCHSQLTAKTHQSTWMKPEAQCTLSEFYFCCLLSLPPPTRVKNSA